MIHEEAQRAAGVLMRGFPGVSQRESLSGPNDKTGSADLGAIGCGRLRRNKSKCGNHEDGQEREQSFSTSRWQMSELQDAREVDGDGDEEESGERGGGARFCYEEIVPALHAREGITVSAVWRRRQELE